MEHNGQFHKFPNPLKFGQCVNTVYFDDQARIPFAKNDLRGASCRLRAHIILFASTLGPRRILADCISRVDNGCRGLTFVGFLL